jgi:hypothetical protein
VTAESVGVEREAALSMLNPEREWNGAGSRVGVLAVDAEVSSRVSERLMERVSDEEELVAVPVPVAEATVWEWASGLSEAAERWKCEAVPSLAARGRVCGPEVEVPMPGRDVEGDGVDESTRRKLDDLEEENVRDPERTPRKWPMPNADESRCRMRENEPRDGSDVKWEDTWETSGTL